MKRLLNISRMLCAVLCFYCHFCFGQCSYQDNIYVSSLIKGAYEVVEKNHLSDSVKNKEYCVFYQSSCRGITMWMVAVADDCFYKIHYIDTSDALWFIFPAMSHTLTAKDDSDMNYLFSFLNRINDNIYSFNNEYDPIFWSFLLFDDKNILRFYCSQKTTYNDTSINEKLFKIFCKYTAPYLIL